MNALTQVEAKRILTVMDELLEDLAIVAALPPYLSSMPAADMQHLLDSFHDEDGGQEVQQQLTEHYDLERRLESASGDMSTDDVEDLHFSTRSLVDTMRYAGYPDKYKAVFQPSTNAMNYRNIIQTLRELLHDRLNTTVEDDVMKFAILNDTVNREKNASADVQALTREHAQEKENRRVEVEKREHMISKLREELAAVRGMAEEDRKKLVDEIERLQEANALEYQQAQEKFENDVGELEAKYKATRDRCTNDEVTQRAGRNRKEIQLSQTIANYDKEMLESHKRLKELAAEMGETESKLRVVDEEVSDLKDAASSDQAEEQLAAMCSAHALEIQAKRTESAVIIQSYYRAHAFRTALANKGKKKGKGKKGK